MDKRPPKLYYILRRMSTRGKWLKNFILKVYSAFQSSVAKVFLPVLFTTSISLEIKLMNTPLVAVAVTICLFLFYLYLSVVTNQYQNSIVEKSRCSDEILKQLSRVNTNTALNIYDAVKEIHSPSCLPDIKDFKSIGYQDAAFKVCTATYNALKFAKGSEAFNVTLFTRLVEEKTKRSYIQMIGFAFKDGNAPAGVSAPHFLDVYPPEEQNDYYHKVIFRDNKNKIYTLCNKDEIDAHFKDSPSRIRQYIGIPVFCSRQGMVSLLQIDAEEDNLLGHTSEDLNELARLFYPLTQYLLVNHNRELLIKCFIKKFKSVKRKKGITHGRRLSANENRPVAQAKSGKDNELSKEESASSSD